MDKFEYDIEKRDITRRNIETIFNFGKYIVVGGTVILIVWMAFNTFSNTENVSGLVKLVEALKLGSAIGYVATAFTSGGLILCTKSKKHAIEMKGVLEKQLEKNDPNRPSTGLNSDGSTPRG